MSESQVCGTKRKANRSEGTTLAGLKRRKTVAARHDAISSPRHISLNDVSSPTRVAVCKMAASVHEPRVRSPISSSHYPSSTEPGAFHIHEDTAEQEMDNSLQQSACMMDISSDVEREKKAMLRRAQGEDKENIPPETDATQTSNSPPAHVWSRGIGVRHGSALVFRTRSDHRPRKRSALSPLLISLTRNVKGTVGLRISNPIDVGEE